MKLTKKQIKEEVRKVVRKRINEAIEDAPKEDWAKFGASVDTFINDTIKKASDLHDEGEKILFGDGNAGEDIGDDKKFGYVSSRMSFLKGLIAKLSQRYESMRRERY